jgi:nucleoside-diphosphate-sugar epimerase
MALLISGGMGHVGFELVRQASAAGLPVVAQYRKTFRAADAAAVGEGVGWARCDLADPSEVASLGATHPIDGCIHAAAVPNDKQARPDPSAAFAANVAATQNLLELARRQGWRRFIYVSTGSVFQRESDFTRQILEDAPPSPVTVYGSTKRCGELLTSMYRREYRLSAATIRISWVYGPPLVPRTPEWPRGPIPYFLRAALSGEPVRMASGGDFAASYTYVGDVAAGLLAAWRAPELRHDVYHLGSGENYDTRRVAAAVRMAVPGATVEVGQGTLPWTTYNTMRGPLAGDRLLRDAGFALAPAPEEGIAAFADWMRAHPGAWQ